MSVSGRNIGVELAEWLNEKEMAASMRQDKQEESILAAIGAQGAKPHDAAIESDRHA